ncbi:MAG: DUF1801 domain-containing protein [Flavobacteriales bacterium]|nr:DUF1801 domain-containing protein [Flavobacteriales bacterium]
MNIPEQISAYINSLPEPKRQDMWTLDQHIRMIMPECKLWYLDGKDETGKVVSNPNVGYGVGMRTYADGKTKEFYKIGISANTSGISVYIMGFDDKNYLPSVYGTSIGKAKVTGYCIRFRALKDIEMKVLDKAIRDGLDQ